MPAVAQRDARSGRRSGDGAYCWHPEADRADVGPSGLLSNLCSDDRISAGGDRAAAHVGEGLSTVGLCDLYVAGSTSRNCRALPPAPDPDGQIRLHVVPEGLARELISEGPGIVLPAVGAADLLDEDDRAPAGPRFCS